MTGTIGPDGFCTRCQEAAEWCECEPSQAGAPGGNGGFRPVPPGTLNASTAEAGTAEATAGPQLTLLSDVEPEHVTWLWDGYLPLGKVAVLDGDPGIGKSTLAVDLAARVSAGAPMPDGTPGRTGAVLVLSAEDGLADTIRPRLDAAGGDPARVIAMTGVAAAGEDGRPYTRPVTLPGDIPLIESVTAARGVLLVVVDVLMAYLSGRVDSYRDQDVRRALAPLAAMAERTGCCVLVLRHLSKNGGQHAVYRGGGSIGIIGAARAAFICGPDPGDDTGRRNVLASSKSNLARTPPSLAYTLEPGSDGCARVAWHGESGLRASALLADPETADERDERDEAAEWLTAWLNGHDGEGKAGDIIRAAAKDGIVPRTLQRARRKAHVSTERVGYGKDGCWVWRLPCPAGGSIDDTKTPKTPGSENQTPMASIDAYDGAGSDPAEARHPAPVLCTVCRLPLWPALAEAGITVHPDCGTGTITPGQQQEPCSRCGRHANPPGRYGFCDDCIKEVEEENARLRVTLATRKAQQKAELERVRTWEWDRLVTPPGRSRRQRQAITAERHPTGWIENLGFDRQQVCNSIFDLGADAYHEFHGENNEAHPVIWRVTTQMNRSRSARRCYYCDAHLPDEFRPPGQPDDQGHETSPAQGGGGNQEGTTA